MYFRLTDSLSFKRNNLVAWRTNLRNSFYRWCKQCRIQPKLKLLTRYALEPSTNLFQSIGNMFLLFRTKVTPCRIFRRFCPLGSYIVHMGTWAHTDNGLQLKAVRAVRGKQCQRLRNFICSRQRSNFRQREVKIMNGT